MRQNDTTNTTSSEPEQIWTILSPQTAVSAESLDLPGDLTTMPVYSSPVTEITRISLGAPMSEVTETTTETKQPKAIVQPTGISLIVPSTDAGSDKTSFITVLPTAHVENSVTFIVVPGTETTSASRAPKMPHLENPGSQIDHPSKPTDRPNSHGGDNDVNRETSGPGASTSQPTQAGVIVPSETGGAEDEPSGGSQTQDGQGSQQGAVTVGGSAGDAEPTALPTFVINNTPLIAGGSPITVDGTTYSLASTISAIAVNGNTVSFTTDSQGQAVPVGPTGDASAGGSTDFTASQALDGLSVVSAEATTTGEISQETGSTGDQQSSGTASSSRRASSTSSASSTNAGASATTDDSAPSVQSDNAGASNLPWSVSAIVGAIGLLAVVV